jgi:hypothetical protein
MMARSRMIHAIYLSNLNRNVSVTGWVTHDWTQTRDQSQPTEKRQTDQRSQEAIPLSNLSDRYCQDLFAAKGS